MKLYTEQEVRSMLIDTWAYSVVQIDNLIDVMKPIELPSDEEIMKEAPKSGILQSYKAFLLGAKWMRDKIKRGNQ